MKAIGIVAGPRKGQLTDRLTDSALKALADRGIEVEKVYLTDLDMKPCMGCRACQKDGRCVIKDDFNALADKFKGSDIGVFSSPVYFANVTSCAKRFFDRGYSMFKESSFGIDYRFKKPVSAMLITSCGAPWPFSILMGISTGGVNAMKFFFKYMRVKKRIMVVTGARDFDEKKHGRLLRKAYDTGRSI